MKETDLVKLAREIAYQAHAGQFRRDGVTPYTAHLEAVVGRLAGESPEIQATGWLHDIVEDTGVTPDQLLDRGMPPEVVVAVVRLTLVRGVNYMAYTREIKEDEIARKVKIADMLSNLCDTPTKRQVEKYSEALLFLMNKDELTKLAPELLTLVVK